jgi:trimeric autotransporter adhesin
MPPPRRSASLCAFLAVLALALFGTTAMASAAAGDIGYEDASFAPLGGSPTGSKPESKLWFNDGTWWASMFNPSAGEHRIYKLDRTTGVWSDTGVAIDPRDSTRADALWDAGSGKLYVASHVFTTSGGATSSGNAGRLYRYSYSGGNYTLDAGFPVTINAAKTETLVIDKDSTGALWATWTAGSRVYVNHSTGNDASWGTPYIVPGAGTTLTSDDISSLIHFDANNVGQIGVMWSNQSDGKFYFALHADGAGDGAWSSSAVPTGASSDDHINLKTDGAGRVYAAVKTSEGSSSRPLVQLLVRSAAGAWSATTFGTVSNSHTRPIVLLDTTNDLIHMFATCPQPPKTSGQSGGDICEKTATIGDSPSFGAGIGTAVIRDADSAEMNDATSTKQNLSAATGLVVQANNATTDVYWHMQETLGGSSQTVAAGFTGTPTTGSAPLPVQFTDTSTGSPTSWSWSFGDGGTSTARNPSHTYAAAGSYTVSLTVSNGSSSDTHTQTGYVTVSSGGGGGQTQTFIAAADAQVKSTSPNTNYGTLTTLRVRQGSSPTDVFYHTYLRFAVSGLSGTVKSATLRLYVTDASPDGGTIYTNAGGWSESGGSSITWANAPPLVPTPDPPIAIKPTAAVGSWTDVDISRLITGTGNGTYDLALASASTNSAIYASREDAAHAPALVITTG